jgi:peptidylamidoglycolate lyase
VKGIEQGEATTPSGLGYRVVPGWPTLAAGEKLGAVTGVSVDHHGDVFVFHRAGRNWPDSPVLDTTPIATATVLHIDGRSGAVLERWGADRFAMPHGLTVDQDDNVWLTDVALHQIYKCSHDGRPLLTLGERGEAGDDDSHFNLPTAIAVAPDGSFYVADGYGNNRVLKFSGDGRLLFQWGTKGTGPGEFDLPHGIARDAHGRVYVADRGNSRVQVFDAEGRYLNEWKGPVFGRPYDVAIGTGGMAFIADGGNQPDAPPDRSALVVVRPDGSVAQRVGCFGHDDGEFAIAHDVAVAPDGAVYVGDIAGRRVQKFVCEPE